MSDLTQYKLFFGDDKKDTIFGLTFSFKEGRRKWNFECGKANSLVLVKKKIPTAFDLE